MGNSAEKQLQKCGRAIHCLSAAGVSLDGPRFEQLFVRNFPSALDFFAFFFHQGKKKGLAGEANDGQES